jgi:hypothetical protein
MTTAGEAGAEFNGFFPLFTILPIEVWRNSGKQGRADSGRGIGEGAEMKIDFAPI